MKITYLLFALLVIVQCRAQPSQAVRDSINRITQSDHEQMLSQLALKRTDMRPGPSGNPSAPNAANASEEKVNNYALPDPLAFKNGKAVRNTSEWYQRRLEIVEDFESEI